jgi:hypothetical protein
MLSEKVFIMNKSTFFTLAVALAFMIGAPAACRAAFDLGLAANYAAISDPNVTSVNFNNSTYNGNIGIDNPNTTANGNYVQFSSGTVHGNFDFVAQKQTQLGGGTVTGKIEGNVSAVGTAYTTIMNLSTMFAGETGQQLTTQTTINPGVVGQNPGIVDGSGNFVYMIDASDFLHHGTFAINAPANAYVVINVTGNGNVNINSDLLLTGGITPDHVFVNVTGTGAQVGGNTNGGPLDAVIVAPYDSINIDNTTINGRVFGGDAGQFSLVSGITLNAPQSVPEPSPLVLTAVSALGFISLGLWRRRRV